MEVLIALLVLFLFGVLIVLPIWTFIKIGNQRAEHHRLLRQFTHLEDEVKTLRAAVKNLSTDSPLPQEISAAPVSAQPTSAAPAALPPSEKTPPITAPPLLPPELPVRLGGLPVASIPADRSLTSDSLPPPITPPRFAVTPAPAPVHVPYVPPPPQPTWLDSVDWEQFMGVKLFAWLGGLALFLSVAYFIKYSLDHGWIPNAVRVALGFVFGVGLVVGGLKIFRKAYAVLAQALMGTGIVSLYAVTFSCGTHHYDFLGTGAMGLVMSLITATAFILAVRLEAQVIAILGILGGFLTPMLLSTGVDNPGGLFGYLTLLDIGLIAVALHRSWFYLVPLGASGTVIMMIGWAGKFYEPGKTGIGMTVCLGFSALFIGAVEAARRLGRSSPLITKSAIALPAVAFCFAWYFLGYREVAAQTELFFGFVILASAGVFILSWREEVDSLVAWAAGISALLMMRWAAQTFRPDHAPVVVTVCLIFCAIYFGVYLIARRLERATPPVLWSAVGLPFVALAFALFLMDRHALAAQPGLLFTFIFVSDLLLLALAWLDERLAKLHLLAGLTVFALLSIWTSQHLTEDLLPWALAVYLLFAALHTAFPLLLQRHRPSATPTWWSQLFPPLTLLMMLLPIFKLDAVSLLIWPAILLVDVIAIALALFSASLAAVAAVLVLTLFATGLCIFKVPVSAVVFAPSLLFVIGGFAVFFFAASVWLVRKVGDKLPAASGQMSAIFGDARSQIPAFSSLLPFLLLIMVCVQLPIQDPSAVFGLGLLLVVLTLGLARIIKIEWLPACALAGMAALEYVWHVRRFHPEDATLPLIWYVCFYLVFAAYPFIFRRDFARHTGPWAVAALSGLAHFWMTFRAIKLGWPGTENILGFVPALFALAPLASLVVVVRTVAADNPQRLNQLAWFGGVALFFITLIFPIQFSNQPEWLTISWSLEGAALLWLFHRVPHPGLRATGVVLLVTAFVRLALNPAVLGYHLRGDTGILNWYLYTYGLATAALFVGAKLLAPPRERVLGVNAPPLLNTLAVILAFILLNIEIADYFTAPGALSLAFKFTGDLARDMTYTIAWALFALGLLSAGIAQQQRAARYAAITLLCVALLKLFFHDLAHLQTLYLVGALFVVGVIAFLASFAYQRFLPRQEKSSPPKP